eukprot:8417217-Pyramimonas_sp.AAC.1
MPGSCARRRAGPPRRSAQAGEEGRGGQEERDTEHERRHPDTTRKSALPSYGSPGLRGRRCHWLRPP